MCAAWVSSSVRLPDFTHTTTFRWTLAVAGAFCVCIWVVTKRFYRSDKSRRTEGLGLGLNLVAAIVKLHGFRFAIAAGPGCTMEIAALNGH
jgi:hypothetical protein